MSKNPKWGNKVCSISNCNRLNYKDTDLCPKHRDLNLYGYCKNTHSNKVVAHGRDGFCQPCHERNGVGPKLPYKNKICRKCKIKKVQSSGLCAKCGRIEKYGMCINNHGMYANDKSGLCSNCIRRGGILPTLTNGARFNSDTYRWCPKCNQLLSIDDFYLYKKGGTKRAKRCKNCNSYNTRLRNEAHSLFKVCVLQAGLNRCVKCWESLLKWDIDHIIPKSLGGLDILDNIQIMCVSCNRKKHNNESIDYRIFIQVYDRINNEA